MSTTVKKGAQQAAKSTKEKERFTAEERAAMKARARDLRAAEDGESAVRAGLAVSQGNGGAGVGEVKVNMMMSLDGFTAGPKALYVGARKRATSAASFTSAFVSARVTGANGSPIETTPCPMLHVATARARAYAKGR